MARQGNGTRCAHTSGIVRDLQGKQRLHGIQHGCLPQCLHATSRTSPQAKRGEQGGYHQRSRLPKGCRPPLRHVASGSCIRIRSSSHANAKCHQRVLPLSARPRDRKDKCRVGGDYRGSFQYPGQVHHGISEPVSNSVGESPHTSIRA